MAIHLPRRTSRSASVGEDEAAPVAGSETADRSTAVGAASPPQAVDSRFGRWIRRLDASEHSGIGAQLSGRGWAFDIVVALGFCGVGSAFLPVFYPEAGTIDFIFVSLLNLPLLLRRRLPKVSYLLCLVVGVVQMVAMVAIGIHDAGLLFSLYSLVGYSNRVVGLGGLVTMVVATSIGSLTDWWGFVDDQLVHGEGGAVIHILTTVGMMILVGASWASGERLRSARIGLAALADRAATLERERTQQARLAAAAERARIAREMHDVIAHGLSVMIAQADGAAYVIDSSPGLAKQALDRISNTGRDSLTQMRALLGLLRGGDQSQRGVSPQPGVEQLSELVATARANGAQVEFTVYGTRRPTASMIELTLYRIVQEGLTNARKHGSDTVELRMDYRRGGIEVAIANPPATADKQVQTGSPGHGLTGMSERIGAVGGTLRTEHSDAGFLVVAWVPYAVKEGA